MMPMIVIAGSAIDLARHERIRVSLQNSLDLGTIAAASLTQAGNPEGVVASYLKQVHDEDLIPRLNVSSVVTINGREVTADATLIMPTHFLRLISINEISIHARSSARETRRDVELSLVLDVSGSMINNGGLAQLRPAAKKFLDIVLKPEVAKLTSVSIVPFGGAVNLGQKAFDVLAGPGYTRRHVVTSCFEMDRSTFDATIPNFRALDQVPHFNAGYHYRGVRMPWCPHEESAITFLSNDKQYLQAQIDRYQPYDGTGTMYAMKWAELLLDPRMKPDLNKLRSAGVPSMSSDFSDRPAPFDDEDVSKFIVLMSDGEIVEQLRPRNRDTNVEMDRNTRDHSPRRIYSQRDASNLFRERCGAAKSKGIKIFTIAFKVNDSTAALLSSCASNGSYAYRVDGLDMDAAFQSIATTMQKLRLVE